MSLHRYQPFLLLLWSTWITLALTACGASSNTTAGGGSNLVAIAVTPASPTIDLIANTTQQFTATGTYADGSTANITSSVTWASQTPAAATINTATGTATAITAGTTTNISANLGGVASNNALLTVKSLSSISILSAGGNSLSIGTQQQFTAFGNYSDGSTENITTKVSWTSGTPGTVTISATGGLATGVSAGTASITATAGLTSNAVTLTVSASIASLSSISITPLSPTVTTATPGNTTQQFTAIGTYSDGSTATINSNVNWTSSLPANATISASGLVTGVSVGSPVISASYGGITSNTVSLTVRGAYQYALITDGGNNGVTTCTINSNGTLSSCAEVTSGSLNVPYQSALVGSTLYVGSAGNNTLAKCTLSGVAAITGCAATTSYPAYTNTGIVIDGAYAYVTAMNDTSLWVCNYTGANLTGCIRSPAATGLFTAPFFLAKNGGFLYVTSTSAVPVKACAYTASTGTISSCFNTNVTPTLGSQLNIVGNYMYLNDYTNHNILVCTVGSNGNVSGCGPAGVGSIFSASGPHGAASDGVYVYATGGAGNNSIYSCLIGANGTFTSCASTGSNINNALGITLY